MSGVSWYDEAVRRRDPVRVEHGVEVVDEFGPVGLRDPGQDHAEGGLAVPGVLQDLPDRPVGVPAGAGHEQPQVRGVEELVGELVVRLHHRIDVRRVQQRDAARHALARREHEQPVPAGPGQAFLPDPGQRGQEVVLGEPVDLVGVAGQHRAVRRRPAHAGGAHVRADDAVHQRGLAGAGGADQGDEHRRGGAAHPGQQVVVDLAEELAAFGLDLGGTGDLEDEGDGGDPLPEVEQGGLEQARVDPDVRLGGGLGPCAGPGCGGLGGGRRRGAAAGSVAARARVRTGRARIGTGSESERVRTGRPRARGLGGRCSEPERARGLGRHGRELNGHGLGGPGPHEFGLRLDGLRRDGSRLDGLGLDGLRLGGLRLDRLGLAPVIRLGADPRWARAQSQTGSGAVPDGLGGGIPDGLGASGGTAGELHRLGLAASGGTALADTGRTVAAVSGGGAVGKSAAGHLPRERLPRRREAGRGLVVARILIPCDSAIVSIRITNVIQFVRFNLLRRQFRLRLLG